MTAFDRFERGLPALFDELAAARIPDYTDDLLARTAATRQRPGWAFLERWLPMAAFAARISPTRSIPWRLGAIVALLAVAAMVAALLAGAFVQPSNVGPGRNGEIVLVDKSGNVVVADPVTGSSRTIVAATPDQPISRPIVSPDGTKFLVLRPAAAGSMNIFVVDLAGRETLITPESPLSAWHYIGWSPIGDRVLLRDEGGRLLLLDAVRPGPPFSISKSLGMGNVWIEGNFNPRSTKAFRPPDGNEILFSGNDGRTLAAVRPDGTGLRVIVDVRDQGLGTALDGAQWSPDGRQIAFVLQEELDGPFALWTVDANGSKPHRIGPPGEQWAPMWSPDGKRIAFEYWTPPLVEDAEWDHHPITIVDLATGTIHEVGDAYREGYLGWEWSPDGTSILQVPKDGFGKILIVDAATGEVQATQWDSDQAVTWQRLPPE